MFLEIYGHDCSVSFCIRVSITIILTKGQSKIKSINWHRHVILTVEKIIRCGTYHAIHRHAKANNKYMKDYYKNKGSLYFNYWDLSNSYGWAMSQSFFLCGFIWAEKKISLIKISHKITIKLVIEDIFLNLMLMTFTVTYTFFLIDENWKWKA